MFQPPMKGKLPANGPQPTPPDGAGTRNDMEADADHLQLKSDLGVPADQEIPNERMQQALAGQHGPDTQRRAQNVKAKGSGPSMGQIFAPARHVAKDNKAQPKPQQPPAPKQKERFKWGKE